MSGVEWAVFLRHVDYICEGYTEAGAREALIEDGAENVGVMSRTLPGEWTEVSA